MFVTFRFCIGDKFYLDVTNNKILCEYDYEERMVFAQMAYNYTSLAQLKRQISQQADDFDEVGVLGCFTLPHGALHCAQQKCDSALPT